MVVEVEIWFSRVCLYVLVMMKNNFGAWKQGHVGALVIYLKRRVTQIRFLRMTG